jgi:hypothetical protein
MNLSVMSKKHNPAPFQGRGINLENKLETNQKIGYAKQFYTLYSRLLGYKEQCVYVFNILPVTYIDVFSMG